MPAHGENFGVLVKSWGLSLWHSGWGFPLVTKLLGILMLGAEGVEVGSGDVHGFLG